MKVLEMDTTSASNERRQKMQNIFLRCEGHNNLNRAHPTLIPH